jgi:hypothetical protein
VLVVEEELRERLRELGLADARRPQEEEGSRRPVGSLRPARERRTASATAATARFCPMIRRPSSDSRFMSFSVSPCMSLPTGCRSTPRSPRRCPPR